MFLSLEIGKRTITSKKGGGMMKKKWLAPTLLASALALGACGSDNNDMDNDDDNEVETPQVEENEDKE